MTAAAFETEISERDNWLFGPWRSSRQMLHGDRPVAAMLLNLASIKDSYANYERERQALYG